MYVIVGATGNTGGVVAKRLIAAGKKVRGIGRSYDRLQRLAQAGVEPFVADLTNREALVDAFTGAEAVYVMIPPNPAGPSYRAHQDAVSESIASALNRAKVRYAVALSSIGADKPDRTGPVVGLHKLEERLNGIAGLNALYLRAGYFMENTLAQVGPIQKMDICAGPLLPELKIGMIAARDIGSAAADALLRLDFTSHQTRELLGTRDITMNEVASIIGKAIGKPDLKYTQVPDDQVAAAMRETGMSANLVELILEMTNAMNTGHMKALEQRNAGNTTPTSYETFVQEEFLPAFKQSVAA